jgi:translocation and assembly module TamA
MQPLPAAARRGRSVLLLASLLAAFSPGQAVAFDFFGLFGSSEEPPAATPDALPYAITVEGTEDSGLRRALEGASTLYRLRQEAPPDGEGLLRRTEVDLARLTDVVWGAGYYDGRISIAIGRTRLEAGRAIAPDVVRRVESYRGREPVPVRILVEPGPIFTLRSVTAREARTGLPFAPEELPSRIVTRDQGRDAASATVLAAEARIIDHFRNAGHPFAKVTRRDPVVDHPARAVDIAFLVDPGPFAHLGSITVRGTEAVDPAVVRSFIYATPGDPYSPKALADIRRSVSRIEALGSVRVREGEALDASGGLPIAVDVTERPPRLFGFSARFSTVDGPGFRTYWAHRNLFGGAERLRLEADLFYADRDFPRFDPVTGKKEDPLDLSNLGGRFTASFLKPALYGTRWDFLLDATAARETTESYTSRFVNGTAALRYRFTDTFSVQGGLEVERGQSSDSLGQVDYTLVGLPLSVTYDSTDSLLDPTRGIRATASVAPYPEFMGSDPGIVVARAQASTYYALDEDARYVLAGRLAVGSIAGAALDEIPANRRFYAGGGGSVRGYEYRTLSPVDAFGEPIGGRSLIEGSFEARIKVTDTIGIVPFVDAGTAFESSFPDFDETIRVAAGLGLRYYTAIGPIRLDVAVPLNPRPGDPAAAFYISLGQAF